MSLVTFPNYSFLPCPHVQSFCSVATLCDSNELKLLNDQPIGRQLFIYRRCNISIEVPLKVRNVILRQLLHHLMP